MKPGHLDWHRPFPLMGCVTFEVAKPLCFYFLPDEAKIIILIPTLMVWGEDLNSLATIKRLQDSIL